MMYGLPKSLQVCGVDYPIRFDYRAVLDICTALADPELTDDEKGVIALDILYPDFEHMPPEHYKEAIDQCFWFIRCGQDESSVQGPKLVDWSQDFPYIVSPINRVLGMEIRAIPELHWWSFMSAYYEIGDCLFAQIVRIRDAQAKGKKLEKAEAEWLRQNRHLVEFKQKYTSEDDAFFEQFG